MVSQFIKFLFAILSNQLLHCYHLCVICIVCFITWIIYSFHCLVYYLVTIWIKIDEIFCNILFGCKWRCGRNIFLLSQSPTDTNINEYCRRQTSSRNKVFRMTFIDRQNDFNQCKFNVACDVELIDAYWI